MVDSFEISTGISHSSILSIDSFKGVLREYFYKDIIRSSKTDEIMMEVFLENHKKIVNLFESSEPIPDVYISNYNIFIRMTSIHNMYTYSTKFTLSQGIRLYESDESIQRERLFDAKDKLSIANVRRICDYLVYKTRSWNMGAATEESPKANRNSLNHQELLPGTDPGLKLNCNLSLQLRVDDQQLFVNLLLLYRNMLSLQPLQIASIVYNRVKECFIVFIYDVDNSWTLKKKLRMSEINSFVPYAKQMLRLELHEELGERIFKAFKNNLILHSYRYKPSNMAN